MSMGHNKLLGEKCAETKEKPRKHEPKRKPYSKHPMHWIDEDEKDEDKIETQANCIKWQK